MTFIIDFSAGMIPGSIVFGKLLDLTCEFNVQDLQKALGTSGVCKASGRSGGRGIRRGRGPPCVHYDVKRLALTLFLYGM